MQEEIKNIVFLAKHHHYDKEIQERELQLKNLNQDAFIFKQLQEGIQETYAVQEYTMKLVISHTNQLINKCLTNKKLFQLSNWPEDDLTEVIDAIEHIKSAEDQLKNLNNVPPSVLESLETIVSEILAENTSL